MKFKEAIEKYDWETIAILVEDKKGQRIVVSKSNLEGGVCGCCHEYEIDDDAKVLRIVDMEDMEVIYGSEGKRWLTC